MVATDRKAEVMKSSAKSMMSEEVFDFGADGRDAEHVDVGWKAGDVDNS